MKTGKLLDLLFYFLLIGAPRGSKRSAISKTKQQTTEPINKEIFYDYFFEYLSRLGILVVIFYAITEMMTKFYFDYYKIIYIVFALIIGGSLHTLVYFLHSEVFHRKIKLIYQITRIAVYSVLPGFFSVAVLIVYREINQIDIFSDNIPYFIYAISYIFFLLIGLISIFRTDHTRVNH